MTAETFIAIVCAIGAIVSRIGYRYFSENVYLK